MNDPYILARVIFFPPFFPPLLTTGLTGTKGPDADVAVDKLAPIAAPPAEFLVPVVFGCVCGERDKWN